MSYQVLKQGERPNKRSQDRTDLQTDGRIVLSSGFKIAVNIEDMSPRGAKLKMSQFVVLPDTFTVEIFSPDRTKMKVCIATRQWQRNIHVGLHFKSAKIERLV